MEQRCSLHYVEDYLRQVKGGVFVVLLCGLAIAVVVAIFEFCYNSKRTSQMERRSVPPEPHQSLCAEMAEELCFALRCRGSRQRPVLKRQCSKCITGTTYVPAPFDIPQLPPPRSQSQCPSEAGCPMFQRSGVAVPLDLPPHLHYDTS